ncbi:MAG: hypothetical protein AOA65_0252 [Candidatus Bathyarchaeota archaeon BA1]|nr:MAG: hypothetical protein AOA65_0252 [Candidatus Bathyarchaeota archaeon BA1]
MVCNNHQKMIRIVFIKKSLKLSNQFITFFQYLHCLSTFRPIFFKYSINPRKVYDDKSR